MFCNIRRSFDASVGCSRAQGHDWAGRALGPGALTSFPGSCRTCVGCGALRPRSVFDETVEPRERLDELIGGFRATQIIRAATMLAIPDLLSEGPVDADAVAGSVRADPVIIGRLMRCLVALGVFGQLEDGRFVNTVMGDLLRDRVPNSMRSTALGRTDDRWWSAWAQLPTAVKNGGIPYTLAHGRGAWDDLRDDADAAAAFNAFMRDRTIRFAAPLAALFDFSTAARIIDVGGGSGALLGALLQTFPAVRGTVFDLPAGLADTAEQMAVLGVSDRCEISAGSFFHAIPTDGDVYLLRQILHDWPDEQALSILRVCRSAMAATARLLVIELHLPAHVHAGPVDRMKHEFDLHMFVLYGGRERTENELRQLLDVAGFAVESVLPSRPEATLVAVPTHR